MSFAYFLSQQRGARSVCDYVDFLRALLFTSPDGGGSGVWATEQTVFGCFERWPAVQEVPVAELWLCWTGCLGRGAVGENTMCLSDSLLSDCKAKP